MARSGPAPQMLAVAASLAFLTGCGGGEDAAAVSARAQVATLSDTRDSLTVRIEGCVVNHDFAPLQHDVQALRPDGRLAQSSRSDREGVFVLRVPANSVVRLRLSNTDDAFDGWTVSTGTTDVSLGGCLIDFSPERRLR